MKKRLLSGALALTMFATLLGSAVSSLNWTASTLKMSPYSTQTASVGSDASSIVGIPVSSDTKVAYISGAIHADSKSFTVASNAAGTCNITVTYNKTSGGTDTCVIPVVVGDATSTSTDTRSITLAAGQTDTGTQYYNTFENLTSSNTSVATVRASTDGHYITVTAGYTSGSAVISGRGYRDGQWYGINLSVSVHSGTTSTTGVTVNGNRITMPFNASHTLSATHTNIIGTPVSSNTNVATASLNTAGNQVTIASKGVAGEATITYTYANSTTLQIETATYYVTVSNTSNTATTQTISLAVNGSQTVSKGYMVSSPQVANSSIATVTVSGNSMTITGKAAGETTITYQYKDNSTQTNWTTGTITVKVTGGTSSSTATTTTGITFQNSAGAIRKSVTVAKGKTYRLGGIKVDGTSTTADKLLWLSTNTSVVNVNSTSGKFKALKAGTTRLIVVNKEGTAVGSISITVK